MTWNTEACSKSQTSAMSPVRKPWLTVLTVNVVVAAECDTTDTLSLRPDLSSIASVPAMRAGLTVPKESPGNAVAPSKPRRRLSKLVHQLVSVRRMLTVRRFASHAVPEASRISRVITSYAVRTFSCTRPRCSLVV